MPKHSIRHALKKDTTQIFLNVDSDHLEIDVGGYCYFQETLKSCKISVKVLTNI